MTLEEVFLIVNEIARYTGPYKATMIRSFVPQARQPILNALPEQAAEYWDTTLMDELQYGNIHTALWIVNSLTERALGIN